MDNNQADRRGFLRTGAIAGTALVAGASEAAPALPPEMQEAYVTAAAFQPPQACLPSYFI